MGGGDGAQPGERPVRLALTFLAVTRLVLNTSHRFVYPFLPAVARGLDIGLARAGWLLSLRSLAGLSVPLVVAVAGRRGRTRRVAATGLVLAAAGAMTVSGGTFAAAIAGFALLGAAKPVYDVAAQTYLADRTPYRSRARTLAALELPWAGGLLVGAPVAGWLIARFGWQAPFVAIAAGAVLAGLLAPWFLEPAAAAAPTLPGGLPAGPARALLLAVAAFTFAAEVPFVAFGAWLEDSYGISLVGLGSLAAVIGVAELAGESATLAFADRVGKRRTVAAGLTVSTVAFGLLPGVSGGLAGGMAAFAVALAGFELAIVASIPLASELRPRNRAGYLALVMVAVSLGRAAGAPAGTWLFEAAGLGGVATAAVAGNAVALTIVLARVPADPRPA